MNALKKHTDGKRRTGAAKAAKKTVFLTGATGNMGFQGLRAMMEDLSMYNIVILVMDDEKDRSRVKDMEGTPGLRIKYGDLTNMDDVMDCVRGADLVLHVAALVSPVADDRPELAMKVNYGGMRNIVQAVKALGQSETTKVVAIGTIAETGDRMPPIHWGRVGDPIKPSMFDYYAVSKVAAERYLIESGLTYWASLRQTGIMGPGMSRIRDAIMFHNCLDNVLEYVSDRDSGTLLRNMCREEFSGRLKPGFWGHIYNIGGGESCRVDTYSMYKTLYGALGFTDMKYVIEPRLYATRNFHGQYYLDSDKLNDFLHFRHDSMQYFYDAYLENLGSTRTIARLVCGLPGGQRLMGAILRRTFRKQATGTRGTLSFIEENREDHIDAYWGSRRNWEALGDDANAMRHFTQWDRVVPIDHGYDESKPESELTLQDMRNAAAFRGGRLVSPAMRTGDWSTPLTFTCAFGHTFAASPRLVLEGGHWCDQCESASWNYSARAKVDPFFAQVWTPLHDASEPEREYPKIVSERDV